jgi:hypothetical protein
MTGKNGNLCFTTGTGRKKRAGRGEGRRFSMSLEMLRQEKGTKAGDR